MSTPPPRLGVRRDDPRGHALLPVPGARPAAPAPAPSAPPAAPPPATPAGPPRYGQPAATASAPAPGPARYGQAAPPAVVGNRLPAPYGAPAQAARPAAPGAPAPAQPGPQGYGGQAAPNGAAAQALPLPRPSEPRIVIGINDVKVARTTGNLVTIGLGSCIGVCIYDAASRAGGLVHYMLPDGSIDAKRASAEPLMFGDRAVAELVNAFRKIGGRLEGSFVYIAGGASMNPGSDIFDIGSRNAVVARDTLARLGLKVARAEIGGRISRTLALDVVTGLVTVSTPGLPVRRLS